MADVEFFFDLSSPWTRLAFHNIKPILAETNASVLWRPFLVGGVFNAVNSDVYASRSNPDHPKLRAGSHWLDDWAKLAGVPMNFPSEYHPLRSVAAMRFCCVLEDSQEELERFADHAFDAYFRLQLNLDDPSVLVTLANEIGMDGEELLAQSTTQANKDRLRANTEEAIARGSFGSPTILVGERLYFGNDQLPLVRMLLSGNR